MNDDTVENTTQIITAIGILHENNPNKQNTDATEFTSATIEDAIRQSVLLDNFEVPCYVAIGTNQNSLEIIFRNNTLINFESLQELNAIKTAQNMFGG